MNRALKKVSAMLMSVMLALTSVPYSYAATVDSGSETSYSVQNKAKIIARAPASGGDSYAAVLRADKVANDAQTKTQDGYSQQVETKLSEAAGDLSATYFEQDKYISAPTGEKNGQSTYNVTLENAYVGPQIQQPAPDGQDIVIIEDASASMNGRVQYENEGVQKFLMRVQKVNNQRIQNAKNGLYTDFNPDGKTEAEITAWMKDNNKLLRLVGVESFNATTYTKWKQDGGSYVLADSDVTAISNASALRNGYPGGPDLKDLTGTDKALQNVRGWISNPKNTSVVLLTDGEPYGDWSNDDLSGGNTELIMFNSTTANNAISIAKSMKAQGISIYASYMFYESGWNNDNFKRALAAKDISVITMPPYHNISAVTLSLISSDYPGGGHLGTVSGGTGLNWTFTVDKTNANGFGTYMKLMQNESEIAASIASIAGQIDSYSISKSEKDGKYAATSSYILDDISHPFALDGDISDIKVYQVPRVPKNLDATGHPADATKVSAFTWGDKEDITDKVSVTLDGNRIKVTGYNYEANALTTYDHDMYLPDDQKPADPSKYEKGDYGYKVVLEFPICANRSFGGNDIETNDSTTSAFYPSTPGSEAIKTYPVWTENTDMNPDKDDYIALYPVPIVDLKVNYAIVSDNAIIYAPQTEKLVDLVSSEDSTYIFNVGKTKADVEKYKELYQKKVTAEKDVAGCKANYMSWQKKVLADPEDPHTQSGLEGALDALNNALAAYRKAYEDFQALEVYIPDGDNNAFVNITYTLKDPDGNVVGTMNIPHGTALSGEADGTGNLKWTFTDGDDATVKKSGVYTVSATVTPVYTTREESFTGSADADETCQAETYTKNPTAYIYVLQITMKDTKKKPGQSLDFANDVAEDIFASSTSSDKMQIHWVEAQWVCTDGTTPSKAANEPADNGAIAVGKNPTGTVTIADMANIGSSDGSIYVSNDAADGSYIPVKINVHRTAGNLNKTVSLDEQIKLVDLAMSDEDHLYGTYSSILWKHACDIVDDCDHQQFKEAHDAYDNGKYTGQDAVRFLVHIEDTVLPDVEKETSTPTILQGEDIKWTVTVSNDDEEKNESHKKTRAQMLDVLPYLHDGRANPNDNTDTGSSFGGDLYFKTISVDCASAQNMKGLYTAGNAKFYYTEDTAVRTASREEWYDGNIAWTAVTPSVNGNTVSFTVPKSAVAIKSDAVLNFGEKMVFNLTSNVKNPDDQQAKDTYINQAYIGDEDQTQSSDPVVTTVTTLVISGTVWYDDDNNGMMDTTETKTSGTSVSLYREQTNDSTESIALDGTNLEAVYNSKEEKVAPYITGDDGYFEFNNLLPGTYYIVATNISEDYKVTKKQEAGVTDELSSKAEEAMPAGQTAWIKKIVVSNKSVEYQNIGLVIQKGTLTIQKAMENGELYYPSSMTDEQKKDLVKGFIFKLTNNATGEEYTSTLHMDIEHTDGVSAVIEDLPLGTYTLKEESSLGYDVKSMTGAEGNFSYNETDKTATIVIAPGNTQVRAMVVNKIKEPTPGVYPGESVANHIGTAKPIKLIVDYAHGDINDTSAISYTFKESDFANMTLWYDDGTYRDFTGMYKQDADGAITKLSEDRLKFSEVTLSPATITNTNNTSETGNKIKVYAYHTERGKKLSDTFSVGVNLAPTYKFTVVFHANGSSFGGTDTNSVRFMYNDTKLANDIVSGVYRQPDAHSGWTFAGWNTASDGSGVNYASLTALNELGAAKSETNRIDLYAHWTTLVTFHANGGTNYRNGEQVEPARSVAWTVGSALTSDGMTAEKTNFTFVEWNLQADGLGVSPLGQTVTGPMTVYAAYYQTHYPYTGNSQEFIALKTGTYYFEAVGGAAKSDGGTASGYLHLTKGTKLYVYVGDGGLKKPSRLGLGGVMRFNGGGGAYGGSPVGINEDPSSGAGATDIRTINTGTDWSNEEGLKSRIMVAGGAGGYGGWEGNVTISAGDSHGGGLTGGKNRAWYSSWPGTNVYSQGTTSGGTQTSGYAFGYGQTAPYGAGNYMCGTGGSGGGGGGWYGGTAWQGVGTGHATAGGGGSGYVSGFTGCETSATGYVFDQASLVDGRENWTGGGCAHSTDDHCLAGHADIRLVSVD